MRVRSSTPLPLDALLLDLGLPDLHGTQLTTEVRRSIALPRLVLSASRTSTTRCLRGRRGPMIL